MIAETIKEKAEKLIGIYGTRDPFAIARKLGIHISYRELGHAVGLYCAVCRCKFIYIGAREQVKTCAYLLGYALLHPDTCIHLLCSSGDDEAAYFASCLLSFKPLL